MELTIVMPCLNEAETVATCVRKAVGFLAESGMNVQRSTALLCRWNRDLNSVLP